MNMCFKLLLLCWHIFYDTINLPFAAYNAMFTDLRVTNIQILSHKVIYEHIVLMHKN